MAKIFVKSLKISSFFHRKRNATYETNLSTISDISFHVKVVGNSGTTSIHVRK